MFHLSLINYFELGALLVSLWVYPNLKTTPLRLFPFFLGFILLTEGVAGWLRVGLHQPAPALTVLGSTTGFIFYAFVFRGYLQDPLFKKMASVFMIAYPLLVLADRVFIKDAGPQPAWLQSLGAVCMILFCCCFFYELLLNPVEEQLRRDPMFWISTGILFFHLGGLTYNLLFSLLERYAAGEGRKLFQNINNNLILMLYSCFIIAFLCLRGLRKSSLQ
jgi:hypothetical protein